VFVLLMQFGSNLAGGYRGFVTLRSGKMTEATTTNRYNDGEISKGIRRLALRPSTPPL